MHLHSRPARTLRVAGYAVGGLAVAYLSSDVGGVADVSTWWSAPIVFQKLAIWTLLWELVGAPAGPRHGGAYHWFQTETLRLPPWPRWVSFTGGSRRTVLDVALYVLALAAALVALGSGSGDRALPALPVGLLIAFVALLALRDRTAFLAARPEWFGAMLVIFTFPAEHQVFALKLAVGAAVAHLLVAAWSRRRPPQVSVEAALFLAYAACVLFLVGADVGPGSLPSAPLSLCVFVLLLAPLALRLALPGPQGVAWLFRDGGSAERFDLNVVKPDPLRPTRRPAGVPRPLLYRAIEVGGRYTAYDGEAIAGLVLGRGPGSSDVPAKPLVAAIQYECDFEPGQVRVVEVRGRHVGRRRQQYRIIDAASGLLEAGTIPATDPRRADHSVEVRVSFPPVDDAATTFPSVAVPAPPPVRPAEPPTAQGRGVQEPARPEVQKVEIRPPAPAAAGHRPRPRPRPHPRQDARPLTPDP